MIDKGKDFLSTNIDLQSERKDYIECSKGKSEKYKQYTDWKKHITELIQKLPTTEDFENFKYKCVVKKRTLNSAFEMYGIYIVLLFGCFAQLIQSFITCLLVLVMIIGLIFHSIKEHKQIVYENSFYIDLLDIIEELEKNF